MKFALVGHGKMGREVEAAALGRGHECVAVLDPATTREPGPRGIDRAALAGAEVAFEFTTPTAAEANVVALLDAGVAVVCGTTGWDPRSPSVLGAAQRARRGAVIAPNFSPGMALFAEVVAEASRRFASTGLYDPFVVETHHRGKADAPSGTARKLAAMVASAGRDKVPVREGTPERTLGPREVHLVSVRAGHEPGVHVVGFDGEHDVVTLSHRARGRAGLALGAVLAAEWVRRRRGLHGFEEVLRDVLRRGGRR